MKYAAIYQDESVIVTEFCDTEEEAWQQLVDQTDESKESLESAYYIQGFTKQQIKDLPEVDV